MQPIVERFMAKVVKDAVTGHWVWIGTKSRSVGDWYGRFRRNGKYERAHRASYELFVGPIPAGYTIDHLCRFTLCVNPDHLEAVTHQENVRRGVGPTAINAAKTFCSRGHPYTPENTGKDSKGRRCLTCHRAAGVAYRQRQKAAKL